MAASDQPVLRGQQEARQDLPAPQALMESQARPVHREMMEA